MPFPKSPVILASNDQPGRAPLASWYAQGPSDGFGDRLLMFDNAKTGPLELLRIRPDFAVVPGFEAALRTRFDRLASFNNRGFAQARVVKQFEQGEGLTIVSNHVAGTRLSELFLATRPHPGMHPASVRAVFGDLVSSIAELHRQGRDISHGAIAPERIVLTSERHLVVTDYVFGDALQRVGLSMERLWGEFGIVITDAADGTGLDQRGDVVQLGLLMLSLVLGRHVSPAEYPRHLSQLLQDFTIASDRRARDVTPTLKTWLEQALDPKGFRNAIEAERAMVQPQALPRPFAAKVDAVDAQVAERQADPARQPAAAAEASSVAPPSETSVAPLAPIVTAPPVEKPGTSAPAAESTPLVTPVQSTLAPEAKPSNSPEELEPGLERELSLLRESVLDVDLGLTKDVTPGSAPEPLPQPVAAASAETTARPSSRVRTPDNRPGSTDRPGSTLLRESLLKPEVISPEPDLMRREPDHREPTSPPGNADTAARTPDGGPIAMRELFGQRAAHAVDVPGWKPVDDRASWEPPPPPLQPSTMFRWVSFALGILVLMQFAIIFRLATGDTEQAPTTRPETPAGQSSSPSPPGNNLAPTPADAGVANAAATAASIAVPAAPAQPTTPTVATPPAAAVARTPSTGRPARTGNIRVISPIALQVLASDRVIGSTTSGPIALDPGSYDLTLVNDALNFRTRQTVRIVAARTISMSVAPPPGAISVNASPWAQVWIDGKQVGETPLANISVPIGEHEVTFRHPQFGERKQQILVQAGSIARASVTFAP